MGIQSFTKQPYESFKISTDFSSVLEDGETIQTSAVTAVDVDDVDCSSTVLDSNSKTVTGSLVKIRVLAGSESKTPYKVTFRIVTSLANKWEVDIKMKIKET